MKCLTGDQLIDMLIQHDRDSSQALHVRDCSACADRLQELKDIPNCVIQMHDRLDAGHDSAKEQLMTQLQLSTNSPSRAREVPNRATRRRASLKQLRLLTGAIGAAAAMAFLTWIITVQQPLSAMEQAAQAVRKAVSYSVTMEIERNLNTDNNATKNKPLEMRSKFYRSAGSYRMEIYQSDRLQQVEVYFKDKPGVRVNYRDESFTRVEPRRGQVSSLMMLEKLGRFRGEADQELGTKQIATRSANGFLIDSHKIDEDIPQGTIELWIDAENHLPLQLVYTMPNQIKVRFFDFQWNVRFDDHLFNPYPPNTYTDKTRTPPSLKEQVAQITLALRNYSELFDGQYPQAKVIYGDVTRDKMYENIGIRNGRPTSEQMRSDEYVKVMKAMSGFARMNMIFRDEEEVAFYGKTVGPKDTEKVLFRWKLSEGGGGYQVVFGDLRVDTVSGEQLRELERR